MAVAVAVQDPSGLHIFALTIFGKPQSQNFLALPANCEALTECYQRTSLLRNGINYDRKKFCSSVPPSRSFNMP